MMTGSSQRDKIVLKRGGDSGSVVEKEEEKDTSEM